MLAQAHTFTIEGPEARHVTVELDVRPGLIENGGQKPREMTLLTVHDDRDGQSGHGKFLSVEASTDIACQATR